jgi:hypothetical protein
MLKEIFEILPFFSIFKVRDTENNTGAKKNMSGSIKAHISSKYFLS